MSAAGGPDATDGTQARAALPCASERRDDDENAGDLISQHHLQGDLQAELRLAGAWAGLDENRLSPDAIPRHRQRLGLPDAQAPRPGSEQLSPESLLYDVLRLRSLA